MVSINVNHVNDIVSRIGYAKTAARIQDYFNRDMLDETVAREVMAYLTRKYLHEYGTVSKGMREIMSLR